MKTLLEIATELTMTQAEASALLASWGAYPISGYYDDDAATAAKLMEQVIRLGEHPEPPPHVPGIFPYVGDQTEEHVLQMYPLGRWKTVGELLLEDDPVPVPV